jgi:HK97 family phage portal protein
MNLLQKALNFLSTSQLKSVPLSVGQTIYYLNGQITSSSDNKKSYLVNGYDVNDIIYSIVQLIVEKGRVAPWGVYAVEDEVALKRYLGIMQKKNLSGQDFIKARDYRAKALVPYTKDSYLNELLKNPNPEEGSTFSDLFADSSVFKLLMGDRMIWADRLTAGANKDKPFSLHVLPTQDMSIVVTSTFPISIFKYQLQLSGVLTLDKESILHDKYFNPNYDINGSHLLGLAPMKAALRLTDRSNAENAAALSSYQNGGPRVIVSVDEPNWSDGTSKAAQAKAIKQILTSDEYVGPDNINRIATSAYNMKATPVGLSPVDLDIIESEKWSLRRFCNVFGGVPSQLLNDPDNKVYNNSVEGEKALTSRCALPLLTAFRDKLNQKLQTDWGYKGKNVFVDFDMNVFTELQEDLRTKWAYVKELPTTNRRKLEMMGEDAPQGFDDFMDQIFIPSGFEPISVYEQNDTDRALEEGAGAASEDGSGEELQDREADDAAGKAKRPKKVNS